MNQLILVQLLRFFYPPALKHIVTGIFLLKTYDIRAYQSLHQFLLPTSIQNHYHYQKIRYVYIAYFYLFASLVCFASCKNGSLLQQTSIFIVCIFLISIFQINFLRYIISLKEKIDLDKQSKYYYTYIGNYERPFKRNNSKI